MHIFRNSRSAFWIQPCSLAHHIVSCRIDRHPHSMHLGLSHSSVSQFWQFWPLSGNYFLLLLFYHLVFLLVRRDSLDRNYWMIDNQQLFFNLTTIIYYWVSFIRVVFGRTYSCTWIQLRIPHWSCNLHHQDDALGRQYHPVPFSCIPS